MPDTLGLPGKAAATFRISMGSRGRFGRLAS
jgi:hypothetical protein